MSFKNIALVSTISVEEITVRVNLGRLTSALVKDCPRNVFGHLLYNLPKSPNIGTYEVRKHRFARLKTFVVDSANLKDSAPTTSSPYFIEWLNEAHLEFEFYRREESLESITELLGVKSKLSTVSTSRRELWMWQAEDDQTLQFCPTSGARIHIHRSLGIFRWPVLNLKSGGNCIGL